MSRLSTDLHKGQAVRIFSYFNILRNLSVILAIYRPFLRGYKPSKKIVPFSHFGPAFFSLSKNPNPAVRMAGLASLILSAILVFFPAPAVGAEILSLEQLTAKTQEAYEKTMDLKARFVQEVTIKSMKKTEREEGTVYIKNPKMMYWDYSRPRDKKLVINARTAWLYVPEDRMVYVQNAEDVYRSRMAVKFLSGIGKLSEDFNLRFTKENPQDEEKNYLLTLTAKEKGTGIDRLNLTVDGKTFQILQCRFNDDMGNTTRLRFSDIVTNTGISDKFFIFKPPAGIEVVNMP
jgi:outer membrane lipoprotein carrier protein